MLLISIKLTSIWHVSSAGLFLLSALSGECRALPHCGLKEVTEWRRRLGIVCLIALFLQTRRIRQSRSKKEEHTTAIVTLFCKFVCFSSTILLRISDTVLLMKPVVCVIRDYKKDSATIEVAMTLNERLWIPTLSQQHSSAVDALALVDSTTTQLASRPLYSFSV